MKQWRLSWPVLGSLAFWVAFAERWERISTSMRRSMSIGLGTRIRNMGEKKKEMTYRSTLKDREIESRNNREKTNKVNVAQGEPHRVLPFEWTPKHVSRNWHVVCVCREFLRGMVIRFFSLAADECSGRAWPTFGPLNILNLPKEHFLGKMNCFSSKVEHVECLVPKFRIILLSADTLNTLNRLNVSGQAWLRLLVAQHSLETFAY